MKNTGKIVSILMGFVIILWGIVFGLPFLWALFFAVGVTPQSGEPPKDEVLISFLYKYETKIEAIKKHGSPLKTQSRIYLDSFISSPEFKLLSKPIQILYSDLKNRNITIIEFWSDCIELQYGSTHSWEYFAHIKSIAKCKYEPKVNDERHIIINYSTNSFVKQNVSLKDMTTISRPVKNEWYINHTIQTKWN